MTTIVVNDEQELVTKLASKIEKIANDAIENRGKFYVGFSGGSVLNYLCECLQTVDTDWSNWVVAFCDERLVPENDDDSTFGTYKRELIPKTKLVEQQFIKIKQGVSAQEAAQDYTEKLTKAFGSEDFVFDLLLLGMGPDGHTCSLFPGHPLLDETKLKVAPITDSPKFPPERITLTFPTINKARNCLFAICGSSKAEMIQRILKDNDESVPARRVKPHSGSLYWVLDQHSAKNL
ncbi:hypothetical protein SFRURICE_012127 [Spodoptera frugiperda]|uniref:6-phosphogluconolactonase n=1 Tax=Spodoptera frugiperda TaxID=7108 RepID=A0A2H1WMK7_SPOFR|nr:6-phosphogluconolactonase [Spodoptera frugiperda]KAF9806590.1 hypothetical protein SFRURICE_012127 [Spodoptera frugiperda]